ncbi:MAG: glycoside hydrolase family 3 protein [Alphaproteobacteria bacterium]|nr:glycoside hydrolase family 3 protein [Alphaproteobacteria bacterium]
MKRIILFFLLMVCCLGCGYSWYREHFLNQMIGQMIIVGFNGSKLTPNNPIVRDVQKYHIGGVILFNENKIINHPEYEKNIKSPTQVKQLISDLQKISQLPLFIAIDQEGGKVARLSTAFGVSDKSAWQLGNLNDLETTRKEADKTTNILKQLGFNVNFAPCVDIMLNPDSPIIMFKERSFSSDPNVVSAQAEVVLKSHLSNNVLPVLKHFPGHGSARGDTHIGFVDITDDFQAIELIPYQKLLSRFPQIGVMVAHLFDQNIDSNFPASLSPKHIGQKLRKELSFSGLVFTDDLQMQALTDHWDWYDIVVNAINAGNDILVIGNNLNYDPDIVPKTIDIVAKAVKKGDILPERIQESYQRIIQTKRKLKEGIK